MKSITCPSEYSSNKMKIKNERMSTVEIGDYMTKNKKSQQLFLHDIRTLKTIIKFYKIQKRKRHFFMNYALPNILGSIAFFIIVYLNSLLPCDDYKFIVLLYRQSCETIFDLGFYQFMCYHLLFPNIFKKLKNNKTKKLFSILIFCLYLIVPSLYLFLNMVGFLINSIFMHSTLIFFVNLFAFIIFKLDRIKFVEIKYYYYIYLSLVASLSFL